MYVTLNDYTCLTWHVNSPRRDVHQRGGKCWRAPNYVKATTSTPREKGVGLLCQAEPRAFDAQWIRFAGRLRVSIMVTGGHEGVLHVV